MGCINSKKDIKDVHSNIFHVINIDNDGTELWSGKLEVTRVELTLYRKGKEPTKWPLKCLRRYGYNVDQFSFEAGRRCTTGEGIYAFRCRRAEALFYTVQAYIQGRIYSDENTNPNDPYPIPVASNGPSVAARSVSQNNTATRSSGSGGGQGQQMQCTFVMNRTGIATSQSLSPNGTIHSNSNQSRSTDTLPMEGNYLEPTPNRSNASGTGQPHTITTRFQQGLRLSSVSSGPISPDITSPGSPNSMTNILEVTTLNPLPTSHTSGNVHQGVSNVYQEFPMKDSTMASLHHQHHQLLLHQHHVHHPVVAPIVTPLVGGLVRTSMDVPPLEPAPGASVLLASSITSDITTTVGTSGPTDTLVCGSGEYDQQQPSTPDAIDPARLYMNVNIATSDIGSGGTGGTSGCSKTKKPATFGSKSNSSLISISNITNNNSTNGGHNSTGSFDECQYQNVRTPTSMTAVGAAGMPLIPQNIVTGNIFAQFQRLNSVGGCPGSQFSMDPNRFYENLELAELKAVSLRGRCSKPDIFSNVDLPLDHSEPCTPTATAASQRKVNYIVLDLDQSNSSHSISGIAGPGTNGTGILSPTGTVPGGATNGNTITSNATNNANNFNNNNNNNNNSTTINLNSVVSGGMCNSASGIALGSIGTGTDHRGSSVSGVSLSCSTGLCSGTPANSSGGTVPPTSLGLLPPESPKKASLGYATIDFNKTVALSNSTTPSSELDSEGSRKTRHNSTVTPLARQSNSVSD
ncbi:homeobox protein 5 [Anopheles moucheti]|uniref:homeobox protein 5 n=1 Tax=Anopheles moucheti TaxID=186751 RepID=UPI0022F0EBEA|nr:homeobox protein 5 [Anopheles moucheti]